jgi:hypothetical protein
MPEPELRSEQSKVAANGQRTILQYQQVVGSAPYFDAELVFSQRPRFPADRRARRFEAGQNELSSSKEKIIPATGAALGVFAPPGTPRPMSITSSLAI